MRVIILGARANGHAKVVLDIFDACGVTVVGFLDDDASKWGQAIRGRPILGSIDRLESLAETHQIDGGIAAIGHNAQRRALGQRIRQAGLRLVNAIHPTAYVAVDAQLGEGICLCPGAIVMPGARLGDCVTLYTAATVDHDSVLEDGANLSPGVHTAGRVVLGKDVFVGTGAVFIPDVRVGEGAYVGAGAVVIRDVAPYDVVAGVPARSIKKQKEDV